MRVARLIEMFNQQQQHEIRKLQKEEEANPTLSLVAVQPSEKKPSIKGKKKNKNKWDNTPLHLQAYIRKRKQLIKQELDVDLDEVEK